MQDVESVQRFKLFDKKVLFFLEKIVVIFMK